MLRWRHVVLTLAKELREALRDRRTLAVMILLPLVVYPLLAMLAAQVATGREQQREERPSTVAVSGPESARTTLVARIQRQPVLFRLVPAGSTADVEGGRLDALVAIDASAPARATVVFDASRDESRLAQERLGELLAKALPDGCAPVFALHKHNLAPQARLGGYLLSKALPLFVVLMVLLGAFYPAIDVTAGERERGTLETMLCAPIRRFDLMLGKVLAVAVLAMLTGVLNLASMAVTLMQIMRLAASDVVLDIPWGNALAASLVLVPAALLFAAAFVALGALARTFKEAQTLLLPVYFLTLAPALAGAVGEYRLTGIAGFVPGMNVTLLARDLLVGRATWSGGLATLASTLLLALAALYAAAHIYDSERVVVPPPRRASTPRADAPGTTAGDALVLFALAFLLLYFVFLPIEKRQLELGLLVADWLGMFGLVLLYARLSGRRFAATIALTRPAPMAVLGALLVGCSAWAAVSLVCEWLVPVPKHLVEELRKTVAPAAGGRALWSTLLLMALTPAVCEEALFRGPILHGLRTRMSPIAAAIITGLLFGLFHLDLYRLLPATLLGILLGVLTLESGSIVPAMLAHLCNNTILISLAHTRLDERMEHLGHRTLSLVFFASLVLTSAGFLLLRRARRRSEL